MVCHKLSVQALEKQRELYEFLILIRRALFFDLLFFFVIGINVWDA